MFSTTLFQKCQDKNAINDFESIKHGLISNLEFVISEFLFISFISFRALGIRYFKESNISKIFKNTVSIKFNVLYYNILNNLEYCEIVTGFSKKNCS